MERCSLGGSERWRISSVGFSLSIYVVEGYPGRGACWTPFDVKMEVCEKCGQPLAESVVAEPLVEPPNIDAAEIGTTDTNTSNKKRKDKKRKGPKPVKEEQPDTNQDTNHDKAPKKFTLAGLRALKIAEDA